MNIGREGVSEGNGVVTTENWQKTPKLLDARHEVTIELSLSSASWKSFATASLLAPEQQLQQAYVSQTVTVTVNGSPVATLGAVSALVTVGHVNIAASWAGAIASNL